MLADMGTELQYSPNLFTTLPRSHGNTITIAFDTQDTTPASSKDRSLKEKVRTGSDAVQQPMDRFQCHKDSMRKTMLEHENIFKEQVRELHRLYRTQKLLMSQLQKTELRLHPSSDFRSSTSSGPQACSSPSTSHRHRHGAHMTGDHTFHPGHRTMASLSSQELTVCSGEFFRRPSSSELRPPSGEGANAGVGDNTQAKDNNIFATHVGTQPACSDQECDLELTLSIGCSSSKQKTGRRSRSDTPSGGCPESSANSRRNRTPSTPARSDPGQRADPCVGSDREGLQRPGWLFQSLSLNRT